jgi:hypothetical protein
MLKNLFNKKSVLLLILGLFFFLFSVKFSFLPVHSYQIVLLITFFYVIADYVKNKENLFVVSSEFKNFIYFYLLFLFWILISYSFNEFEDPYMIKKIIVLFIKSIFCSLLFVYIFLRLNITLKNLILYLQIIIFIQALFIIFYFFSIDFKNWTLDFIPASGNLDPKIDFRSRGLMNGASATGALMISFGLIFTAYLVVVSEYRKRIFLYLSISFLLILAAIFFIGRTGFLIVPFVCIYFLVLFIYKKEFRNNIKIFISYILGYLIIIFIFLSILSYLNLFSIDLTKFNTVLNWVKNEINFQNGSVEIKTLTILSTHWFIPDDIKTLLFGNPLSFNEERISSDIGFIRILYGFGLIGSIIFYGFFIYTFLKMIQKLEKIEEKLIIIIFMILLFITEIKEPFLFKVSINSFILLLFLFINLNPLYNKKLKA